MRTFQDDAGATWVASAGKSAGDDYKGRYGLVMIPENAAQGEEVEVPEVRWNSKKTAERTLKTMSTTELRRRLRSATARAV